MVSTCFYSKVQHRIEKTADSIWSVHKLIEINFGLSLTCFLKIIVKKEYINHVIVKSFCLNRLIYELFVNFF